MSIHRPLVAIVLGVLAYAAPAAGQSRCLTLNTDAQLLVDDVLETATASDSATSARRARNAIPAVDSASVQFVQDSTVCEAAALAYERELAGDSTLTTTARRVYVVRAGDVYVVLDPDERLAGEWDVHIVFDLNFRRALARYAA